jgi:hypothetical protein
MYSYNSTVVYGKDKSSFVQKADEFLERIRVKRIEDPKRPLVLIGHSLGGLLLEQALVNAHNNPKYTHIKDATAGLAFFATPHNGGNPKLLTLGNITSKIARGTGFEQNKDVLETLKDDSIFTGILQEHWRQQILQYQIVSFWGSDDSVSLSNIYFCSVLQLTVPFFARSYPTKAQNSGLFQAMSKMS